MGAKHDHALMRVRYAGAITKEWSDWEYSLINQRTFLYGAVKKGFQPSHQAEWEIVCDDQSKRTLLTMLELSKQKEESNDS